MFFIYHSVNASIRGQKQFQNNIITVFSACSNNNTCGDAIATAYCKCQSLYPCTIQLDIKSLYTITPLPNTDAIYPKCNIKDVTLDGRGSTIMFNGIASLFYFSYGTIKGITIKNLIIDMPRDHYTLGQVIGATTSSTTFKVDTTKWPDGYVWTNKVLALYGVDLNNNRMGSSGSIDNYGSWTAVWTKLGNTTSSVVVNKASQYMKNGNWVILRHAIYNQDAFTFYGPGCDDIVLQDITIYSFPGFGIFGRGIKNFKAERVKIMKKSGKPFSIAADGIHLDNTRGGSIIINDCIFEGQGDDGININSHFYEIRNISPDRKTFTVYRKGSLASSTNSLPGDIMTFYKRNNFDILGTGIVASNNKTVITLTSPLPSTVQNYDATINLNQKPDYTIIKNTIFRTNRARGGKLSTSNLLVTGCVFDHTSEPGIVIKNDCVDWYEGSFPSNWTITNNSFIGNAQGSWQPNSAILIYAQVPIMNGAMPTKNVQPLINSQVFNGINITNNIIIRETPIYGINVANIKKLNIIGNFIISNSTTPLAINLLYNQDVITSENKCGSSINSLNIC